MFRYKIILETEHPLGEDDNGVSIVSITDSNCDTYECEAELENDEEVIK